MSRKVLAIMEGEQLPDGRIVDIGAFYVDDSESDRIPVTWANDSEMPTPIGWAHGFQRIEHGDHADLSFNIIMNSDGLQEALDLYDAYLFCTDLQETEWDTSVRPTVRRVHQARIRMIQLVPIPGFPMGKHVRR